MCVCVIPIYSESIRILSSALLLLSFPHCIHLQPEFNSDIIKKVVSAQKLLLWSVYSFCAWRVHSLKIILIHTSVPYVHFQHVFSHLVYMSWHDSCHSNLSLSCSFLTWRSIPSLLLFLSWQIWESNEIPFWCTNKCFYNKYFCPALYQQFSQPSVNTLCLISICCFSRSLKLNTCWHNSQV